MHVLVSLTPKLDWCALVDDGQHFGVRTLTEQPDGAVGAARNDGHAASVTGEVHDVQDLEGGRHPQDVDGHSILGAMRELETKLLASLYQCNFVWRRTLQGREVRRTSTC